MNHARKMKPSLLEISTLILSIAISAVSLTIPNALEPRNHKERKGWDSAVCQLGVWNAPLGFIPENAAQVGQYGQPLPPDPNVRHWVGNPLNLGNGGLPPLGGICTNVKDLKDHGPDLAGKIESYRMNGDCECFFFEQEDCMGQGLFGALLREDGHLSNTGNGNRIRSWHCRYYPGASCRLSLLDGSKSALATVEPLKDKTWEGDCFTAPDGLKEGTGIKPFKHLRIRGCRCDFLFSEGQIPMCVRDGRAQDLTIDVTGMSGREVDLYKTFMDNMHVGQNEVVKLRLRSYYCFPASAEQVAGVV